MRVSLSWLRDFAPIEHDPADVATALDDLGLVVEAMERLGEDFAGVVVARVLETRPHPNADKLQLVEVDAGGDERVQVVCGAFNFGPGDLVPLAPVGARLPELEITRRQIRGEWSNGMLCSGAELHISDDHAGILVLTGDVEPGVPLAEALGVQADVVFDLDVSPNRPDALSVVGVARDVAAKLGVPFAVPDYEVPGAGGSTDALVKVRSRDLCPRFTAIVVADVEVRPSPGWLATRLTTAGMRPINNVVDVSNYVMLELGHPNHPYDLDRLAGGGLLVRRGRAGGETVVTLDDVSRSVGSDDCLICDAEGTPVGIGGILGGAASEIADTTARVLLETAYFDRMAIARTSKRLGLRTEASARFERGVDPEGIERAVARFCSLLAAEGATVAGALTDVRARRRATKPVRVRTARVNAVLGTALTTDEIKGYLDPIGFAARPVGRSALNVAIPTWRPDSDSEIDVIEEVARHHGYSRVDRSMPPVNRVGALTAYQRDRRRVRDVLAGAGVWEAWTTTFLAPDDLARAGLPADAVEVANPLVAEESVLRTSLLPGLLKAIVYNASHQNGGVHLFEIGHVFRGGAADAERPDEYELLAVALAGGDAAAAKRVWDVLADALRLEPLSVTGAELAGLHPTRTGRIEGLGAIGEVDPGVLAAYGVEERVGWFEVDLERLLAASRQPETYKPVSRFPSAEIDLAFVVDHAVHAGAVEQTLRDAGGELLVELRLFDVFRGPQLGDGRRSLAYRLRLNALDRTLTDDEVAEARRRCIDAVESAHRAQLRA